MTQEQVGLPDTPARLQQRIRGLDRSPPRAQPAAQVYGPVRERMSCKKPMDDAIRRRDRSRGNPGHRQV